MIHHSHVVCDDCGERHTPGNPTECIEGLLFRAQTGEAELATLRARVAELEGELLWSRTSEHHTGLRADDVEDEAETLVNLTKVNDLLALHMWKAIKADRVARWKELRRQVEELRSWHATGEELQRIVLALIDEFKP